MVSIIFLMLYKAFELVSSANCFSSLSFDTGCCLHGYFEKLVQHSLMVYLFQDSRLVLCNAKALITNTSLMRFCRVTAMYTRHHRYT